MERSSANIIGKMILSDFMLFRMSELFEFKEEIKLATRSHHLRVKAAKYHVFILIKLTG